jgi:AcrR family transcriptional regulator
LNKSESKYFNTAAKMDEAFLKLLEQKDFAYITVKELCAAAGVNRSTFYLHYETMGDLLAECAKYINEQFLSYMHHDSASFVEKLRTCPLEELYLITPEYLTPYLSYIRANQRLFRTGLEHAATLGLDNSYAQLLQNVITPILDRYGVPEADRRYLMAFHIQGLMGIITQWLRGDCKDSIEHIISVIQQYVAPHQEPHTEP